MTNALDRLQENITAQVTAVKVLGIDAASADAAAHASLLSEGTAIVAAVKPANVSPTRDRTFTVWGERPDVYRSIPEMNVRGYLDTLAHADSQEAIASNSTSVHDGTSLHPLVTQN